MNNELKHKLVLLCTGLVLLIPACRDAAPEDFPQEETQWEPSRQTLEGILSESHYTPYEFTQSLGSPSFTALLEHIEPKALPWANALIKATVLAHLPSLDKQFAQECGTGIFSKRCWEIQSYTFTYHSQTVDGRDVVLSGRVTFPNNTKEDIPHAVKTLSLHSHQGLVSPEWAPSRSLMFMPLKALWDSAVIEPDLQKWGINFGKEPEGNGSSLHMARQLADCTVAALEVMRKHGVTLSSEGYTTNWGSSQGALPALAFAKWYETQAPQWFADALRLQSTFSGEGAVDMSEFMEYSYRHPELIPAEISILPAYFKAFSPAQLGGYSPQDFVPRWYFDTKYQADGREINFLDAVSYYYRDIVAPVAETMTSFDQVVAPDMLNPDGTVDMNSPKIRAWLACLQKHNTLEGWAPGHSIYIAHSREDPLIPFEIVQNLYHTISNQRRNSNVHLLSVPSFGDVPTGGMNPHYIISFLIQVQMACAKDPADMKLLYCPVN